MKRLEITSRPGAPEPLWKKIAMVLAAVLASLAALAAVLTLFGDGQIFDTGPDEKKPKLTLGERSVKNEYRDSAGLGTDDVQTADSTPTVNVRLKNEGDARSVLSRVRVRVLGSADFSVCYAPGGGDDPVAKPDVIPLPFKPRPSERLVSRPLYSSVPAAEPLVLALRFKLSDEYGASESLQAFDVSIETDDGQKLKAGRYRLAFPGAFYRGGLVFPEEASKLKEAYGNAERIGSKDIRYDRGFLTWCYRRNLEELKRVQAYGGMAAPQVEELRELEAPNWKALQGRPPVRQSAMKFIQEDAGDLWNLAVYVAAETGDSVFEDRIRSMAAEKWLVIARDAPRGTLPSTIAARESLAAKVTPEALRLLPRQARQPTSKSQP